MFSIKSKSLLLAFSLSLALAPNMARAEVTTSLPTAVNIQNYHPAVDMYGMFTVDSADINPHLKVNAGLVFNYAWSPLSVVYSNTNPRVSAGEIIAHRLDADIVAAIGFWDWVELGLDIPVVLFQTGLSTQQVQIGVNSETLQATNFGDITLTPKVRLVNYDAGRFSLALGTNFVIPSGNEKAFSGEAGFVMSPYLALSSSLEIFHFAVDLGYRWRARTSKLLTLDIDDEIFYKVGFGFNFGPDNAYFDVTAEFFGATSAFNPFGLVTDDGASAQNPLEAIVGVNHTRVYHWGEVYFGGGVGFGLLPGYGTPKMRVFARAGYYMGERVDDADEDGVPDEKDKCLTDPEDIDGFEDEDGCPDKDNDKDGIPDEDDKCPNEAEDYDNFEDEDGCPDPDNDKDTVPDTQDKCPNEPEDLDGFEDEDGCPDPDNDKDHYMDADDICPNEPEDFDDFEDEDGCPDLDNDKDGIPDYGDLCVLQAEDVDGFEDEDGCPDPDNDGDGLLDANDKCPNEPENINGIDDNDGCPDEGGKVLVELTEEAIVLKEQPTFVAKKGTLKPEDSPVLNQLVALLANHSEIQKIKIQAYTLGGGNGKKNMALSKEQLATVTKYLTGKGIEKKRVSGEAMGDKKPKKGKIAAKASRFDIKIVKRLTPAEMVPAVKPYGGDVDPKTKKAQEEAAKAAAEEKAAAEKAAAEAKAAEEKAAAEAKAAAEKAAAEKPATEEAPAEMEMQFDMGDMSDTTAPADNGATPPAEENMEMQLDMGDFSL